MNPLNYRYGTVKIYQYEAERIIVYYDVKRCIHSEECIRGAPAVFDRYRRPWIDPTLDDADHLAEVILRCPTGALHFTRKDGAPEETFPESNVVLVGPDGPLYLHGNVEIVARGKEVLVHDTRVALCRCGRSQNKPFCDNSHLVEPAFQDPGALAENCVLPREEAAGPTLRVTLVADGPLVLRGDFTLRSGDGRILVQGNRASLCRCGASLNKPFCDGTHTEVGFQAG